MEIPLLKEIVVIFVLAVGVLLLCHRLKLPAIVGYLITGILCGPHGLAWVEAVHEVEMIAEVGIILLLFTIGVEFSISELLKIRRVVLIGGAAQVGLSILGAWAVSSLFGLSWQVSVFFGFLVSLSSTAIVLKQLQSSAQMDSPHGKTALGILIFQDIAIVPMLLMVPFLAGKASDGGGLWIMPLKAFGIIVLVWVLAKWVVPVVMHRVARTRSRELFLLSMMAMVFGVAFLTSLAGLSLALGAFLAGLIISESEYSHQAMGNILPFKDIFSSFFFVSIGMLLDVRVVIAQPLIIFGAGIGILFWKTISVAAVGLFLRMPLRTSVVAGLVICQLGEFSFILSKTGLQHGLISQNTYQVFLAIAILTMGVAPFLITSSQAVAGQVMKWPWPERIKSGLPADFEPKEHLSDHLIIVGFGVSGQHVARTAKMSGIPYIAIEMNPESVRMHRRKGENIFFGDASQDAVLEHAGLCEARILVLVINDPAAVQRVTETAKRLNPKIHLIVRTRFVSEVKRLHQLGADEVIPEELETSVEIFTRVLSRFLIPQTDIVRFVSDVRSGDYKMLRDLSIEPATFCDIKAQIQDVEVASFVVPEGSFAAGKAVKDIGFREEFSATIIGIQTDFEMETVPGPDYVVDAGDKVYVFGKPGDLAALGSALKG